MAGYQVTQLRPDVIRVEFLEDWDAARDSTSMFRELLARLDEVENEVTVLVVAGNHRPSYEDKALQPARGVLYHDNLRRMVVVANEAQLAVAHMNATRAERGLPPIPMFAFETEAEALAEL